LLRFSALSFVNGFDRVLMCRCDLSLTLCWPKACVLPASKQTTQHVTGFCSIQKSAAAEAENTDYEEMGEYRGNGGIGQYSMNIALHAISYRKKFLHHWQKGVRGENSNKRPRSDRSAASFRFEFA
jgi:hypothetical protein